MSSHTLASLVARLSALVPAVGEAPTPAQYRAAVADALADLGRRAPLRRVATIVTVPGQASYALPAGCQTVITLGPASGAPGWRLSPFHDGTRESWSQVGGSILIAPTPQLAGERTLVYAAGYVADASGVYLDLTDGAAQVALLKAQAMAWDAIAAAAPTAAGGGVKKYTQGEVTIERVTGDTRATSYATTASRRAAEYEQALAAYIGPSGMRG